MNPAVLTLLLPLAGSRGDFTAGMSELVELARAGESEAALERSQALLEPNALTRWRGSLAAATAGLSETVFEGLDAPLRWLGLETRTARDRAAVQLARGVLLHRLQRPGEALDALSEARLLAGAGDVRLDATYDLGCLALAEGERQRALIPELSGAQGPARAAGATPFAPPPPPASGGAAPPAPATGAPEPGGEPLEAAREAYLAARAHFVERLRADWQDGDTRANVELVLRRLRELDALEREREQQQQDSDEQRQQPDSEQDPSRQESEPQDQEQQEQEEQQDRQEEPGQQEQQPSEEQQQDSASEEPDQQQESAPEEGQAEERELTREEVQRLLQRLSEHEQEGEEVRARMHRLRRVPVKRDW